MKLTCACDSDRYDDHRVCLPADPSICESAIATDTSKDIVPILNPADAWMTTVPVDADAMTEADLVSSFYEGRPYERGKQLHREFLQKKSEALSIASASLQRRKGKRHAF